MDNKIKVDKEKYYDVIFKHVFDDEDIINFWGISGRRFFRERNMLRDLGYEVKGLSESETA